MDAQQDITRNVKAAAITDTLYRYFGSTNRHMYAIF